MDSCTTNCANQSVGPVRQLYSLLLNTLLVSQCSISPPTEWPEDYGPTALEHGLDEYDFIIIGAGTAGCILADRLSAGKEECKVLIIEAGGDPPIESETPAFSQAVKQTEFDWKFFSAQNRSCLVYANSCAVPRAKMLGGCHGHNAMIYMRGFDKDYDTWEALGNPTWGWKSNVLPYFRKSEQNKDDRLVRYKNGKYHSATGKMIVAGYPYQDPFAETIIKAGIELGYKRVSDFNRGKGIGYGYSQGNIDKCRRQSTAKSYLVPAAKRKNVHVIKKALVTKIEIENKTAIGVRFIINGTDQELIAYSRKEVILSAGSISSPQVLMLSGIGPAPHLRELGIPLVADLPVGENLHDHPAALLFFQFDPNPNGNVTLAALDDTYRFAVHNDGRLCGVDLLSVNAFVNSVNGSADNYPDCQLALRHLRRGTADVPNFTSGFKNIPAKAALLETSKNYDIILVLVSLLTAKSKGTVRLGSRSSYDKPIIDVNYFKEKEDMDTLVRAVRQQTAMAGTRAFKNKGGKLMRLPLPECDCDHKYPSDDYYRCYIRHFSTTLYHPCGTSKMGPDSDAGAVVDHKLRVKGVKNLRHVDASIMPFCPRSNINAAVAMIAEKGADFIKSRWGYGNPYH